MLDDLLKYINNEDIKSEEKCKIFLVLDTDLDERRMSEIREIEQECAKNNIEIITSAPTFEIWYVMHYRKNKLKFSSSKDVKKELQNINGTYNENMNMYKLIRKETDTARNVAKSLEKQIIKNNEELLKSNPHTSIYKILNTIDEFNKLNV